MNDPYQILGISSSASDDEVTQAYRKLAKKYHPDLNPGDKSAERKMQEINAAYEQIRTKKYGGATYEQPHQGENPFGGSYSRHYGSSGQDDGNPFGEGDPFAGFDPFIFFGGSQQQQQQRQSRTSQHQPSSPKMRAVHNFIVNGRYQQAIRTLFEFDSRDAEWFYYSALAHAGSGNRVTAMNHAREAVRKEPTNQNYHDLLDRFEAGVFEYQQAGQGYGFNMNTSGISLLQLCLLQLFCMTCCRPC